MKKLHYTKHLLNRIGLRGLSKNLVKKIISSPQEIYLDHLNKSKVAIGKEKGNQYMVAFIESGDSTRVLTSHPIKVNQIKNRVKSNRWIKIN